MGAEEFINGSQRWCLWFKGCDPSEIKQCRPIMERIERVREFRLMSTKAKTRADAAIPYLFQEIRQPESGMFIVIPEVSSERRKYIPIGFLNSEVICSNKLQLIPDATLYHFGVLTSTMHMAWVKTVCGRLKSDFDYSGKIVYNNFPWPDARKEQQEKIATLSQAVLDARALYPESSLAALYDPLTMPPELTTAHRKLDAAVEKAYGRRFTTDAERVAFLFERYQTLSE